LSHQFYVGGLFFDPIETRFFSIFSFLIFFKIKISWWDVGSEVSVSSTPLIFKKSLGLVIEFLKILFFDFISQVSVQLLDNPVKSINTQSEPIAIKFEVGKQSRLVKLLIITEIDLDDIGEPDEGLHIDPRTDGLFVSKSWRLFLGRELRLVGDVLEQFYYIFILLDRQLYFLSTFGQISFPSLHFFNNL
jgi:hypothetical protein